jgi:hypothetical protein
MGPTFGPVETLPDLPHELYAVSVLFPPNVEVDNIEDECEGIDGDGVHEDPVPLSGQLRPSSLGLSCVVDVDKVDVNISTAQYEQTNGRWTRKPLVETVEICRGRLEKAYFFDNKLEVVSRWRESSISGRWNLTVAVVNRSPFPAVSEGKKGVAAACFYQVAFKVRAVGGFLYPTSGVEQPALNTEEEDELAFRYRNKISYGVGHGCAVSWDDSTTAPTEICTQSIPAYTVPTLAAREGDEVWLGAMWLSNLTVEQVPRLGELVKDYSDAITGMVACARPTNSRETEAMDRLVRRMGEARDRMTRGVDLLRVDPKVLEAFKRANRAMVEQRWASVKISALRGRLRSPRENVSTTPSEAELEALNFKWRPFQLGFALMLVESLGNDESEWYEMVDLIWFPTGGGKTEAYLLVAAFVAVLRRLRDPQRGAGTAVLSRYTLRLLTAQQFLRSCTLFCALELSRLANPERLGASPFEIGLFIGQDSTPNTCQKALELLDLGEVTPEVSPFGLRQCPWCGTRLLPDEAGGEHGYHASNSDFYFSCRNQRCVFADRLPVQVVDEVMFSKPPTMVLAVVDKFALLPREPRVGRFLGSDERFEPLSLIIQDEVHMLGSALGTVFGLYEAAIDVICRHFSAGRGPKIVASTATTRDSRRQIANLFGRDVRVFPPPGLTEDDSFFALAQSMPGRTYLGILSPHLSPSMSLIRIAALLAQSALDVGMTSDERDAYWTNVIYHGSLRLLGKTLVFASDDIPDWIGRYSAGSSESRRIRINQVEQMTSNVQDWEIPKVLERLFVPATEPAEALAILCATNMISVGVDVPRLGLMVVHGQPNGTSEYIQASSRVGRQSTHPGLVVTHYSKTKTRDTSHYETFRSYHHSLYRYVEPTSVTPLALPARERALPAALVGAIRIVHGLTENDQAGDADFDSDDYRVTVRSLSARLAATGDSDAVRSSQHLDGLVREWSQRPSDKLVFESRDRKLDSLICDFGEMRREAWPCGRSFRNVDVACDVRVGKRE